MLPSRCFDAASWLPASPSAQAGQWTDLPWQNGMHTTHYGLSAFTSHSAYARPVSFRAGDSLQRIHLSVWLRDEVRITSGTKTVQAGRGRVVTAFSPGEALDTAFGGYNHHVGLLLLPETVAHLADARAERFLAPLCRSPGLRVGSGDARVLRAAHELDAVLLDPASSALLREAKSLELLARLVEAGTAAPCDAAPGGRQAAQLRQARDLLLADLARAPAIDELARACGLNSFSLKQGFKTLFGTTVHGLYQQERMRRAWELIESGHLSVSEAGQQVGYTNLSHFSAAFRKAFGILPGELKRRPSVPAGPAGRV